MTEIKCWICKRTKNQVIDDMAELDKKEGFNNERDALEEGFKWAKHEEPGIMSTVTLHICCICEELIYHFTYEYMNDNDVLTAEELAELEFTLKLKK